jgi:NADH-quinone oxidoreductase subunit I
MSSAGKFLLGSFSAMAVTARNFFRRSNTVSYPKVTRPIPSKWRGGTFAQTVDATTGEENCTGCGMCESICPSDVIVVTLKKGEKRKAFKGSTYMDVFTLDYQACMQCELCVQVCPTDAIVMTRFKQEASRTREDLFLTKERLLEYGRRLLEHPETTSESTGTTIRAWTDFKRGADADAQVSPKKDEPT